MTLAIYSGSFDPVTLGHLDVIRRACKIFDHLVIAIGVNPNKTARFAPDQRAQLIWDAIRHDDKLAGLESRIKVEQTSGLLAEFANQHQANAIVRGVRSTAEFEAETNMALLNRQLTGIETVFLVADPNLSFVSSSAVKEIAAFGGDVSSFVPPVVAAALAGATDC